MKISNGSSVLEKMKEMIRNKKGESPGSGNGDSPLSTKSEGEPVSSVSNGELPSKSNDTSYFAENDELRQKIRAHVEKALEVERANEAYRQKVRAKINEHIIIFGELRFPRLIPCRFRTKVPWLPWKKGFDKEDILNGFYGEKLIDGFDGKANLAVHLGAASFNLKCVDVDEDDFLEPFILANQAFAETFCVKGQRGAKFFYEKGESADYVRTLKVNSEKAGEFRGGELAMITGIHECGKPYEWINPVPPIAFRFSDIVWPEGWLLEERASKRPRESRPATLPEGRGPAGIGPVCWQAVRQFQKDNAEELVESFLDNAIKESGRYLIGDKHGNPSRKDKGSCSITVSGEYSGCWKDWETRETGTIKDIIGNFHELTELQVVEEYEKWGDESLRWPAQTDVPHGGAPPLVQKAPATKKPELLLR